MRGRGGAEGGAASTASSAGAALARGAIALLLLLFSLLCAVLFAQDQYTGFFARLWPLASPLKLYLPAYAACMGLCGLAGALGLGLAAMFYPATFGPPLREAGLLVLYILCLGAFSLLCAALFAGRDRLVAALPFVMIFALLFSPILIDLTQYIPGGGVITFLLPTAAYLKAVAGQPAARGLALSFAVYLAAGLGIMLLRRRRSAPRKNRPRNLVSVIAAFKPRPHPTPFLGGISRAPHSQHFIHLPHSSYSFFCLADAGK